MVIVLEGGLKPYSFSCSRVAKSCFSRPQRRAESSNYRHEETQMENHWAAAPIPESWDSPNLSLLFEQKAKPWATWACYLPKRPQDNKGGWTSDSLNTTDGPSLGSTNIRSSNTGHDEP